MVGESKARAAELDTDTDTDVDGCLAPALAPAPTPGEALDKSIRAAAVSSETPNVYTTQTCDEWMDISV